MRRVRTDRLLLFVGAALIAGACQRDGSDAKDGTKPGEETAEAAAFRCEHEPDGTAIVIATEEAAKAAGLEVAPAAVRDVPQVALAYGVLAEDPAASFALRAPLAGRVEAAGAELPAVGAGVAAGAAVMRLVPRVAPLTPAELSDWRAKLAEAQAAKAAAEAELDAATRALERARKLNAQDKAASDQAVESAAAAVLAATARGRGAAQSITIYTELTTKPLPELAPLELALPAAGTVVELGASVGEAVEAGQELLRVADLARLLARVTLPESAAAAASFTGATVVAGDGTRAKATLVGPAPAAAPLGRTLLLRVAAGAGALRPGQAVTAELELAGAPLHGVAVPAAALVRFAGATWVYVQREPRHYARTRVELARFTDDGAAALLRSGVAADGAVVARGAASLLSQEQVGAGGGGE